MSTKRKSQVLIDSDSSGSSEESLSDLENGLLTLSKKKMTKTQSESSAAEENSARRTSDSDSSDSDNDWDAKERRANKARRSPAKRSHRKMTKSSSEDGDSDSHSEKEQMQTSQIEVYKENEKMDIEEEAAKVSELEEGEVSDSDDNATDSSQEGEFNDGYDDKLMGDDADRARLAQMSEKEREQEIFKRVEQREIMKTRFEIERKLRLVRKQEQNKNKETKKKESGIDEKEKKIERAPDLKERSKDRKKTIEEKQDKKFHAMSLLKARREEKKERDEKEKQRIEEELSKSKEEEEDLDDDHKGNKMKLSASDIYSDDSGSSDSDEDEDKKTSARRLSSSEDKDSNSESEKRSVMSDKINKPAYISTNAELNKIRLSRYKMEQFVHLPIFSRIVKGCYVRIGIGNDKQGLPVYKVAEIVDVCETGKIYQLGKTRTNKGLRLRQGRYERVFRLEFISNQEFTDSEFLNWKKLCNAQGISLPTFEEVEEKIKDIREGLAYEYKEEDVERIVREKGRFKQNPRNYAMKKATLIREREVANLRGDDETSTRLTQELSELEERASELDKMRTSTISSISYINDRNRKKNVEGAEKAIREEMRANKGKEVDDPFTRRSTRPRMVYKPEEEGTHETPAAIPTPTESPLPAIINSPNDKPKESKIANPLVPDYFFDAHNFDISIDLEVPVPSCSSILPKPTNFNRDSGPRKTLNLDAYKKKRGLI